MQYGQSGKSTLWTDKSQYGVVHTYRHGTLREQRFTPKQTMNYVALSADCELLCTASGDKLSSVFEVASRKQLFTVEQPDWVRCCAFSQDKLRICSGCDDGFVRVYTIADGEEQAPKKFATSKVVTSVVFSPDDCLLLTSSIDRKARLFDVKPLEPEEKPAGEAELPARPETPDPFLKKKEEYPPPIVELKHDEAVHCARFAPDGRQIVTASGATRFGGVARLWDTETGGELGQFEVDDTALSANFNPDATRICVSSKDKTARTFDVETGQELRNWQHPNWVQTANWSHNGKLLCTACHDGHARIFDVQSRAELQAFRHPDQVTCAQFTSDDLQLVTTARDAAARVWGAVA